MSKSRKTIIACVIVSVIAFICAIVFFYQYSVCAENAQYATETAAAYYSLYGFSDPQPSLYDSYASAKDKADQYLTGGILSGIVCIATGAFAFVKSKKAQNEEISES